MEKKAIKVELYEVTHKRFEELAARIGLTVEDAAAEVIKERVKMMLPSQPAAMSIPTLEAQVFAQCVDAMSVLTEPESFQRIYEWLGRSWVTQAKIRREQLDIEIRTLEAALKEKWDAEIKSDKATIAENQTEANEESGPPN